MATLAASQAFERGSAAGYHTAGILMVLLPLALAWLSSRAAGRPNGNRCCLLAFAILMSGCAFVSLAVYLFKYVRAVEFVLSLVTVVVLIVTMLASAIFAVVGLDQCSRQKTPFWRGRAPALASLVLIVAMCALLALAYRHGRLAPYFKETSTASSQ